MWPHPRLHVAEVPCRSPSLAQSLGCPRNCALFSPQSLLAIEYVLLQLTFCHPLILFSHTVSQPWLTKTEQALRINSSASVF